MMQESALRLREEAPEPDGSEKTYEQAVSDGHYAIHTGGLAGKHDNVRTYWEDQIRGIILRPHLQALVDRKRRAGEKVRIADLGAGSGEGLRLLTSWIRKEADLRLNQAKVIPEGMIDVYVGCDLCEAMVEQGNRNYEDKENVVFRWGDFSKGFPLRDEKPFDLYFSSYASCSHATDDEMELLLSEIAEHAPGQAVFVGDWFGRHSVEWPCYWDEPGDKMLDYTMSWISDPDKPSEEAEHFPGCFWLGDEIRSLATRAAKRANARIRVLELYDVSMFVGRHVDTREYNEWASPVRHVVNKLHEPNIRTNLDDLRVKVLPVRGYDHLDRYFAGLQLCWNSLVDYCQRRLEGRQNPVSAKNWRTLPAVAQMGIMMMDRVFDAVSWMRMGDPRGNIIEPQLGYALRNLELELQLSAGRGHSLVGAFEIRKS